MVEVGTRIVCVEILEHCVSGFPGEAFERGLWKRWYDHGADIPSHGPRPVCWRVGSRHEQVLAGETSYRQ